MDQLKLDLLYAFRSLLKSPGYALVTILTLALGIGANSAMFAVADATLLRPLPFARPDRLVSVSELRANRSSRQGWSQRAARGLGRRNRRE